MSQLPQVFFHSTARALHRERLLQRMLSTGDAHPSLHYLSARQSALWMRVHEGHAPLFQDDAFLGIFERTAARLAEMGLFSGVLALGPGGGEKEVLILNALSRASAGVEFVAIDASAELALTSVERAGRVTTGETVAVVGDLEDLGEILEAIGWQDNPMSRVVTAFGITPNILPDRLLPEIRSGMRRGDVLAISANLAKEDGEESLPGLRDVQSVVLGQYDNSETRQWLARLLVEEGLEADYGAVEFRVGRMGTDCAVIAESRLVSGREGLPETLRLFFSLRFTERTFASVLQRHGFQVLGCEVTPCGHEGVWLCVLGG
jgi:L-histidine Nalpha-methyltransferase